MRKNKWSMICAAALALSLMGCGGESASQETTTASEVTATDAVETTTEGETETESEGESVVHEMRDISSMELVKEMKIGWNLGNTLDSTSDTLDITADASAFEMAWGAQYTSQLQIDTVLEAGFNVIRIPCSWTNHIYDDGSYTIESTWMDRVQEIVDYAYERGAYVILNLHHEDWHYPSYDNEEAAKEEMTAVWTQIGERFADYGDHLIFEGMNEPRDLGASDEWTGNDEAREVINHLNATFIETIRGLGGNNAKRHLMIPGYAASSWDVNLKAIEVPEDDDKIIVSVHAYIPYNFALNTGSGAVAEWNNDTSDIDTLMKNLDELFISKGTPVIIGEFGAMNRDNEEERAEWASYYVSAAKKIGVVCCWWDNHSFNGSGENFGLLKTMGMNMTWKYPDLLQAMMDAAYAE
jgi:endoglucanase